LVVAGRGPLANRPWAPAGAAIRTQEAGARRQLGEQTRPDDHIGREWNGEPGVDRPGGVKRVQTAVAVSHAPRRRRAHPTAPTMVPGAPVPVRTPRSEERTT
jgi:hypothetical protein